MNMLSATRNGRGLSAKGAELPLTDAQRGALSSASGELIYGLRPEDLSFAGDGLPGTLTMIEPTGPETYALVGTAVGMLTARIPGALGQSVGERVSLQWPAHKAHLFDAGSEKRLN